MIHLREFNLKCLLALALTSSLAACSGGDGGAAGVAGGASVALSWDAPSLRADNTPLNSEDIAGFRIYYGFETGVYQDPVAINNPAATQAQISNLPSGTYFVVMTTIDSEGRESAWSMPELELSF
ncbi:MAG: hypothetical protein IMF15_10360 [Proteobacteria bacterium]|nr:hypothetical protein [Pseudomonadota bacterium]